jgi:hypothetical protein
MAGLHLFYLCKLEKALVMRDILNIFASQIKKAH